MVKDKNTHLVYSTDPEENRSCPRCKELLAECTCAQGAGTPTSNYTAKLRIEKNGRKGKTVTIIDELPKIEVSLKALATEIKTRCGAGGTYIMDGRHGVIEIQGDKRDIIRSILTAKGIKFKG